MTKSCQASNSRFKIRSLTTQGCGTRLSHSGRSMRNGFEFSVKGCLAYPQRACRRDPISPGLPQSSDNCTSLEFLQRHDFITLISVRNALGWHVLYFGREVAHIDDEAGT